MFCLHKSLVGIGIVKGCLLWSGVIHKSSGGRMLYRGLCYLLGWLVYGSFFHVIYNEVMTISNEDESMREKFHKKQSAALR